MSERTPLVQAARDVLAEQPSTLAPPSEAESAAIVAAMAEEIVRARRRTIVRRSVIATSIAASIAAAALVGFVALRPHAQPTAIAPVAQPTPSVAVGHRLVVPADGHGELALPSGSRVEAFANTNLVVASLGASQSFTLDAGEARFHVKKLGPGERFLVHTTDADVEVRGTVFSVTILGEPVCGSHTRVDVLEGVVAVSHDGTTENVVAGAHFPVCAPAPVPSASVAASATQAPASTIAAQNQLFAAGVDAKKRGDRAAAIAAFDTYLARYPHGFLAESAEVERMRLTTGPQRLAAAKTYLARHPQGFARAEAKAILDASP
jgi:hypothetical protein